jgi:hypothetical protein
MIYSGRAITFMKGGFMQGPFSNLYIGIRSIADLDKNQHHVLVTMATYANPDGSNMRAGSDLLASQTRLKKKTVLKVLADLRARGLIEQMRKEGNIPIYKININIATRSPNFTPAATPQRTEADKMMAAVFEGQGGQLPDEERITETNIPQTPRPALTPASVKLDPKTGSISQIAKGGTVRTLYPDSFIPPTLNTKGDKKPTTTESAAPRSSIARPVDEKRIAEMLQHFMPVEVVRRLAIKHGMPAQTVEALIAAHHPDYRKM